MFEVYFPLAEVQLSWPVLALLGLAVGTLQGFFGVGGGWLTTPALNILGFPIVYAIGTDLAFTAASAAVGSFRHHRLGNLDLRLAAVLGLSGMLGMEAARRFVFALQELGLAESSVRLAYILLLIGVGVSILLEYRRSRSRAQLDGGRESEPATQFSRRVQAFRAPPVLGLARAQVSLSLWVLIVIGLGVGLLAGFLGTGGGFIMVPVLVYLVGVPTRVAVASSLFSILITNGYGAAAYGASGVVELVAAGLMLAGALVGTQVGATATVFVRGSSMRGLLGATLVLAGIAVVLRQLQLVDAAAAVMFSTAFLLTLVIVVLLVKGLYHARQRAPEV